MLHRDPNRNPGIRLHFNRLLAIVLILAGCQSRPPMRFAMCGPMNVQGKMDMSGDMDMSGKIKASLATDNTASRLSTVSLARDANSRCGRVVVVDVDGLIVNKFIGGLGAMSENPVALFREKLDHIERDPSIKAVVLRINSPGGGVTASDMMSHDLASFRRRCQIPVVACIMDVGAGGAYYLACGADTVVAHPTSIVGGVGVILNLYNVEDTMGQFNVVSIPVKAGNKIDLASPERKLTQEDRASLQSMADGFHKRFIEHVKERRSTLAHRTDIFDGRVVTGQQAVELGFIDGVGYLDDAVRSAMDLAQLDNDAGLVMLRRDNDRAYTALDISPNIPMQNSLIPIKVPGLERSSMPTFLYLWQPEPSFVTSGGG